jgi:hypothetical protein
LALEIFGIDGAILLDEPDTHNFDYANINAPVFFWNTVAIAGAPGVHQSEVVSVWRAAAASDALPATVAAVTAIASVAPRIGGMSASPGTPDLAAAGLFRPMTRCPCAARTRV